MHFIALTIYNYTYTIIACRVRDRACILKCLYMYAFNHDTMENGHKETKVV